MTYTANQLIEKLHEAQKLLAEVYGHYDNGTKNAIADAMSVADGCVWESIDAIKKEA